MTRIKIATDSTANIPKSICEERNISVLPLTILGGEKEYRDGVDITPVRILRDHGCIQAIAGVFSGGIRAVFGAV